MDSLASLFPVFISTEVIYTMLSVGLAAAVFFYFIYLLRKEEPEAQENEQEITHKLQTHIQ